MFKRFTPILLALCAFSVLAASASAVVTHEYISSFNGAEEPNGPFLVKGGFFAGAAVDSSSGPSRGDVYVGETSFEPSPESSINKFNANGSYVGVHITGAETPQGSFGFVSFVTFQDSGFAVDGSNSANAGDLYVADVEHGVVDKFDESGHYICQITGSATPSLSECDGVTGSDTPAGSISPTGVAVGASGDVYVADGVHSVIDEFAPTGEYIGQIADPHIVAPGLIAVDPSGDVYVTNEESVFVGSHKLFKFDAGGSFVSELDSHYVGSVAVDPSNGRVFVDDREENEEIVEFDAAGDRLEPLVGNPGNSRAMAVSGVTGDIYKGNSDLVEIYGPAVVTPDVITGAATDVQEKSATLNGHVEPDVADNGGEVTSCQFEYGTTTSYGQTAPCSPATPYSSAMSVSADIGGLTPDTEYHFRVSAGDTASPGHKAQGEDKTFITTGPASITDESALPITKVATLRAQIDSFDSNTTCQAQYVSDSDFQGSGYAKAITSPCAPSSLGAEYGNQSVSVSVSGLQFDSKYHYRFIATNQTGTTTGADQTFTTFGINQFSFESVDKEGKPYTQAGGHPYQWNVRFALNTGVDQRGRTVPDANIKNIVTELPVGFVGDTTATPQCPAYAANQQECSGSTQVGVLTVYTRGEQAGAPPAEAPVFNVVPPPGVPAQLAVEIDSVANVFIDANARTGGDYGITAIAHNSSDAEPVRAVWLRLWGVPAEKSHNGERACPRVGEHKYQFGPGIGANYNCEDAALPLPFLINPSACEGPQTARLHIDSWSEPGEYANATDSEIPATTGCEHLSFQPKLTVQPENQVADSPSGLWVELHVPQNDSPEGLDSSTLKKAVVALPPGVSVSPSAADGLVGCSPEQIGLDNADKPSCPNASKIGTVEITTPLIPQALAGEAYIAQQNNNPFNSMVAIYVVAEVNGALVKLAGKVELNPVTGQIVTTFDDTPQIPFENFKLYFFGGPRGPLAMPISCGTFTSTSELTPWGAPQSGPPADPGDFFGINSGCTGGFAPKFVSGVTDPQAGAYTNFVLSFERSDGEGEPAGLTMSLPPGLLGKVGEVPLCSNADAITGECPADSQIGTVEAGTGPGSNPLFLPGKIYLTGPYNGGPYGTAVVVPAIAGPYNLGNVVVRQSIRVDHNDAHVQIVSDPFPTIVDGVPLRMRRVDVTLNRPEFMINPTTCAPMSIKGTLSSVAGELANVESRFQLTNCGALAFKPQLALSTTSHTSRANGASLNVTLTYPKGSVGHESNIRSVKVDLPKQLPSRLTTLQKACTAAVFESNPAACPPASIVGTATATTPLMPVTLTGPAYFVSHGGAKFPELIVVLSGDNITVYLHGETFISKAGITSSTFRNLPDVPVGQFHLNLPQGSDSALAANGNLCASKLAMPTSFVAQNGLSFKQSTPITVTGCARHKTAKKAGKGKGKHSKSKQGKDKKGKGK